MQYTVFPAFNTGICFSGSHTIVPTQAACWLRIRSAA